jgi:hypothetical protein
MSSCQRGEQPLRGFFVVGLGQCGFDPAVVIESDVDPAVRPEPVGRLVAADAKA